MSAPLVSMIEWLQTHGVLDFINASTTVALAGFAAVQLRQVRKERISRDAGALSALKVETMRLEAVADTWRQQNLLHMIRADAFQPDQILPKEWGVLLPLVGQLGSQPARLVGNAYVQAEMCKRLADVLVGLVQKHDSAFDGASRVPLDPAKSDVDRRIVLAVDNVRDLANEVHLAFDDAVKTAPNWSRRERWVTRGALRSKLSVQMQNKQVAKTTLRHRFVAWVQRISNRSRDRNDAKPEAPVPPDQ